MHPLISLIYNNGNYRRSDLKNGIFFYGQKELISDSRIKTHFNLYSRAEIFNYLDQNIPNKLQPFSYKEFSLYRQEKHNNFYFIDSRYFRIPTADWLTVLSSFEYFIASPGMIMPQCHNIIEAMSLGVIPILQFPDAFSPKLNHLENCIVFNYIEELPQLITNLLNMNKNIKSKMSDNVKKYYEDHISPRSFRFKLDSLKCSEIELVFNAEEKSIIV
jgi:hypothetical protein